MPQGICQNKDCGRLVYDTEKLDELPDTLECQHCGTVNAIRRPTQKPKLKARSISPASEPKRKKADVVEKADAVPRQKMRRRNYGRK